MEIHWYTPEDIERIANEPCEECGRAASECNCPDSAKVLPELNRRLEEIKKNRADSDESWEASEALLRK